MMRVPRWTWLLVVVVAGCGSGTQTDGDEACVCDGDEPVVLPDDPSSEGGFNVGAVRETVSYEDPDVPGRIRELPCLVWFPTDQAGGEPVYYQDLLRRDEVAADAPAAAGPFPVVVFSHGAGGVKEQSYGLTEYLARHGFVVPSCDHVGNTTAEYLQDENQWASIPQSLHDRPYDVRAIIDALEVWNTTAGHPFEGRLDLSRLAMAGHSMGAFGTLISCGGELDREEFLAGCEADPASFRCDMIEGLDYSMLNSGRFDDPRIRAGVSMAPAGYPFFNGAAGLKRIGVPVLVMGGDRDTVCTMAQEIEPIYAAIESPKVLLSFRNAGHFSFTNMCDLIGGFSDYIAREGCDPEGGFVSEADAFRAINRYSLAFIRRWLDDDPRYETVLVAEDPVALGLPVRLEADPD